MSCRCSCNGSRGGRKDGTILRSDTANTRSFCRVNDNIFRFFLSLLVFFFFSLFKLFFGLRFETLFLFSAPPYIYIFYLSISSSPFCSPDNLRSCRSRSMNLEKIPDIFFFFFARIRTLISNSQKSKSIIGFYSRLFFNQTRVVRVSAKLKPKRCTKGSIVAIIRISIVRISLWIIIFTQDVLAHISSEEERILHFVLIVNIRYILLTNILYDYFMSELFRNKILRAFSL